MAASGFENLDLIPARPASIVFVSAGQTLLVGGLAAAVWLAHLFGG